MARVEERHADRLGREDAAGVYDEVRHACRLGSPGRVIAQLQGALVVYERQLQHDRVGAGVRSLERRAVEQFRAAGAGEAADGVAGVGEERGDRRALRAGRTMHGDGLGVGDVIHATLLVPRG